MNYKFLPKEEQDKIYSEFMMAQERDHYCHTINLERYDNILKDPNVSDELKNRIAKLKVETTTRLHEVEKIIEHTKK